MHQKYSVHEFYVTLSELSNKRSMYSSFQVPSACLTSVSTSLKFICRDGILNICLTSIRFRLHIPHICEVFDRMSILWICMKNKICGASLILPIISNGSPN
jgi:hypothetical protein